MIIIYVKIILCSSSFFLPFKPESMPLSSLLYPLMLVKFSHIYVGIPYVIYWVYLLFVIICFMKWFRQPLCFRLHFFYYHICVIKVNINFSIKFSRFLFDYQKGHSFGRLLFLPCASGYNNEKNCTINHTKFVMLIF